MRIGAHDAASLIQQSLAARLSAATQARRAAPPASGAGAEVRAIGVRRAEDSAEFSGFVIRTREQVRAETALAGARAAPFAQTLAAAEAPTQTPGPARGITSTQAPIGAVAAQSVTPPSTTPAATPTTPAEAPENGPEFVTNLTKTPPRVYGEKDLDAVRAAWGSVRGDRGYTPAGDANNDGVVNFSDNTFILSNWGRPVPTDRDEGTTPPHAPDLSGPFGQEHIDAVTANFGAKTGEDRYKQDADANGDGVIDFSDITHILSNWGLPRSAPNEGEPSV